jgi:glyoxalase family protein
MTLPALGGLHHLTAITAKAGANLTMATKVLGLRLVKRTVNQDDVSAYHLFYGDAIGRPGTELTFFEWSHIARRQPGTGEVAETGLRVSGEDALAWWETRLRDDPTMIVRGRTERAGRAVLRFSDAEGQPFAIVADGSGSPPAVPEDATLAAAEAAWKATAPVSGPQAILGLGPVLLNVRALDPTARFLTQVMGMREAGRYADPDQPARSVSVFSMGPGGAAAEVHVVERSDLPRAQQGFGGVHHVAFRVPDHAAQEAWLAHLRALGVPNSGLVERYYFESLYFREPGGTLFELATDGPGFANDEDAMTLGERLALPPFLEPGRARIEAGLRPLPV